MQRSMLIAAVLGGLSSSAFGGFTITKTITPLTGGLQQIDLYALNTGNGTGTGLLTYELTVDGTAGSRVFFRSTAAGAPNIQNTTDTAKRSYFRIDDEDASMSSVVSRTPAAPSTWTLAPDQGASTVGQEDFRWRSSHSKARSSRTPAQAHTSRSSLRIKTGSAPSRELSLAIKVAR